MSSRQSLRRLIAAARKAHELRSVPSPVEPPPGFATRVAAQWVEVPSQGGWAELWERLCWYGASASVAVCLLAFTYPSFLPEPGPFDSVLEVAAAEADLL